MNATLAFISFIFMTFSVYLLNDLVDRKVDRLHYAKKNRPFAANQLSLRFGILMIFIFLSLSYFVALRLSASFQVILSSYFCMTMLYSALLKKFILIDIFTLSTLYTLRIIAGVAAIHGPYNVWLIIFSLFFFLSLAYLKRYVELSAMNAIGQTHVPGRGYHIDDRYILAILGIENAFIAAFVSARYIMINVIIAPYSYPWFLCLFLLLYWITNLWRIATRGNMPDDPVLFLFKDVSSFVILTMIILILWFS